MQEPRIARSPGEAGKGGNGGGNQSGRGQGERPLTGLNLDKANLMGQVEVLV